MLAATLWRIGLCLGATLVLAAHPKQAQSEVRRIATGLDRPLFVTAPAGDRQRIFIVEQRGQILLLNLADHSINATPFLTLSGLATENERGLLGLAFHPDYATNGLFYVNYTETGGDSVIAEYSVSENPDVAFTDETRLLTFDQPQKNHNGAWMGFGPDDGYLYISTGDGGGGNDDDAGHDSDLGNGQDITDNLLGKILRIDVDRDEFPADPDRNYGIPNGNPFVGVDGADEVWAFGLRHPWRCSFDRGTGDLWISDVGQSSWEEISFQPASSAGGENYGWNTMEGSNCFQAATCNQTGLTMPVLDYDHSNGACSVTGGYVYRGTSIQGLTGTYFYADFCARWIRSFRVSNGQATELTEWTTLMPSSTVASFGQDANGELYIIAGSSVYRIVGQ